MTDLPGPRAVVLGAAGFLGSHLVDRLHGDGWSVLAVDNLVTGRAANLEHLAGEDRYRFIEHDITRPFGIDEQVDVVYNLASPAAPPDYLRHPIATLRAGSLGTEHGLELAAAHGARFVQASTSEIYGDPDVNPQPESYWGNANPIGPRSVYDEAKRYGEALVMAYRRARGVNVGIVRIFNTYGPRMRFDDGRAVPTFILASLEGDPLPVHGDGSQTRSLCFCDDLIDGLAMMGSSDAAGPINLGSGHEVTILELAGMVARLADSASAIEYRPRPEDDPNVRRPDITLARKVLGWEPVVPLEEGIARTIAWYSERSSVTSSEG